MKEKKVNFSQWVSWFVLGVLLIVIYKTLDNFADITRFLTNLINVLMPFLMGILLAYILYIPCRSIEACLEKTKIFKNKARGISIFVTYVIVVIAIVILLNFILPAISKSITELISNAPNFYGQMYDFLANVPEDSIWNKIDAKGIVDNLSKVDFKQYLSIEYLTQYLKGIVSFATIIFDVFVTLIMSVYILAEREKIICFLKKLTYAIFKEATYKKIADYFNKTNEIFYNFISGQVIDAVIVGIITSIAMWIMGVKYAVLFGFLIGLFNLIPYIGAIVAVALTVFITIFTGGISKAIWVLIVVVALQQIDANIINPKILGDRLEISKILIIFSVTFAGAYFGILGMFLAVPVIAVIQMLITDYISYKVKEKTKNVRDEIQ